MTLSNLESNYYDTCSLTLALHPSETEVRLSARVMAYLVNARQEHLRFTKGLSEVDQPDIWARSLDDKIELWIDVGEPAVDRIKKASRLADVVKVYSFNSKSDVWWQQNQSKISRLKAWVYRFDLQDIKGFTQLLTRTMDYSVTITGNSAYIATEQGECEIAWELLQEV